MTKAKISKWPLVANTQITEYLKRSIKNKSLGGAYIFCGPDNLGKTSIALFFAQILFCKNPIESTSDVLPCGTCVACRKFSMKKISQAEMEQGELGDIHSDFHIIKKEKDKKNISIDQIRDFIHILNLSSFSNGYKVGIIKHADTLSREAANALLKTLEEPRQKTLIILICQDQESLPKTIVSRSQILQFKPVPVELIYDFLINDYGVQREKARDISRLSLGRPALAVKLLENKEFFKFYDEKARAFIDMETSGLSGRFRLVESFFDKKTVGQEAVVLAHRILEIWQGLVRDHLLSLLGLNNLTQHIYLNDQLKKARKEKGLVEFTEMSKSLMEAHKQLEANVNPRLVLENVALKINL